MQPSITISCIMRLRAESRDLAKKPYFEYRFKDYEEFQEMIEKGMEAYPFTSLSVLPKQPDGRYRQGYRVE